MNSSQIKISRIKIASIALSAMVLAACGGSNSSTPVAQFEVSTTNLTNAQPMSPVAVIMHSSGFNNFVDGRVASLAVESLAEGGDNSQVLSVAAAASQHISSASTVGELQPRSISSVVTLDVPITQLPNLRLSVMSMLIRTNDAFTGLNATDISNMTIGSSRTFTAPTWDAGTELDDELAANIPGFTGGEGFNATRNDAINRVRFHNGVVTNASPSFGLSTSSLVEADRFLNPTSRIVVTRIR